MASDVLNIGFGNVVLRARVVAILSARSSKDSKAVFSEPMKRLRDDARESGRLVDATCGRRTQTLIVTDSGHVILSAIQSNTLAQRLGGADEGREA
ncbi:MAG: extracellular matrix/biofilm biosynthesis regulator RemA family protein [Candidatus Methylomirabilales bacterium]